MDGARHVKDRLNPILEDMVGLGRFELPTHGLGNLLVLLILKRINILTRQNADKSGKIRNPRATKTLLISISV